MKLRNSLMFVVVLPMVGLGQGTRLMADSPAATEADAALYEAALRDCTPGTHVIPSLMGALFGIDLVNRANIQGDDDGLCVVEYTFATPAEPEVEAPYLLCAYPPAKVEQMLAAEASGEAVDISDECEFYEDWMEPLDLDFEQD